MGRKFKVQIKSVMGGHRPAEFSGREGQYLVGLSIDPEFPIDSAVRPGAAITPVSYAKFSGSNISSQTMAIITNPKDSKTYYILSNGKIVSYDNVYSTETLEATCAGSVASGGAYYNNYIYVFGTGASSDDVSRFGPLDNSPSLTDNFWKGTLSLTALGNPTYPIGNVGTYPKHWGFSHVDNKLYFCDFNAGSGLIHYIKTKKTTNEGDTNDGSTYSALMLPFNMRPSDIESYGTDLAIIAFQTTDTFANQGRSAMYLWDTTSASWYREVPIVGSATAILNNNGDLYVFSGELVRGYGVSRYLGGYAFEGLFRANEGYSPYAGGVDSDGFRILWASNHSTPARGCGVYALGYRDTRLPSRAVNHIHICTGLNGVSTSPTITAIKQAQQNSGNTPRVITGWTSGESSVHFGADAYSASASGGTFISEPFVIGQRFKINKIRIPLSKAVASTTAISAYLVCDGPETTTLIRAINNTNDPGKKNIVLAPSIVGDYSFAFEMVITNTAVGPSILLPITIEGELIDD